MAGPWEKYQTQAQQPAGPWTKYQQPVAPAPAAQPPVAAPVAALDGTDPANDYLDLPLPGTTANVNPPEASMVDTIMGGLDYGASTGANVLQGMRRGATNVLGLPVDAINAAPMLANLIPGVDGVGPISDNPIGGSKSLDSALTFGGAIPDVVPKDPFQRVAGRVGQELGAALVPAGGAIKLGGLIGNEAIRALPGLQGKLAQMFLDGAATSPGKYLAKEATIATGAGMGAGALNEATGNTQQQNPWIDAGGAVAGAGLTGIGTGTVKSMSEILRALMSDGKYADEVVKEAVMRKIADSAAIPASPNGEPDLTSLIQQIEGGQKVSDVIPGYQDSLADRTKIPGIAALEYSRQSGPNAGKFTQLRSDNSNAIDMAMNQAAPDPSATPGQFADELAIERQRLLTDAGVTTANAQDAYNGAVQGLQPLMTAEARGADLRQALEGASDNARTILDQIWGPINNSTQQVDMTPLQRRFNAVTADQPLANDRYIPNEANVPGQLVDPATPATPTGLVDQYGNALIRPGTPANGMQPLDEITALRSTLTDQLRAQGITPKQRAIVEQYVSQIDGYMQQNLPPDLLSQYQNARRETANFNDRFTRPQTAIAQTLGTKEGQYTLPNSAVPGKFVQSDQGRIADFEALMRETGDQTLTQNAVRDQILQDVRDRGLMENPQALTDYLGQYGTVFNRFPNLRTQLGNASALRTQLGAAQQSEQALTQQLTQQGKSAVANYLTYGNENASKAMQAVLSAKDPSASIDELLRFVNDDPKAVEGARKVFWDILQDKSRAGGRTTMTIDGKQPWSPGALNQFLDNPANTAVAERLYANNPEHLQNIRDIAEALKGVDTRNSAKAPNTSGTGQSDFSQILTPETLQSRFYAYRSGKISGSFLIASVVATMVRRGVRKAQEQGFQNMLDEVLTNPDAAALLMKQNNPANRAALASKAKLWFGNEASTILNAMSADDEEDESMQAMRVKGLN